MFYGIDVKVKGDPKWPQRCACCGREANTTTGVDWVRPGEHRMVTTTHYVPACSVCCQHRKKAIHSAVTLLGLILLLGGLMLALLVGYAKGFAFGLGLFTLILIPIWLLSRVSERSKEEARRMLRDGCTGADFVSFRGDVFTFSNGDYAVDFLTLNNGVLLTEVPGVSRSGQ
jgi:hypothetical protein